MMRPALFPPICALSCALVLGIAPVAPGLPATQAGSVLPAQPPAVDSSGLERFARVHVAIQALRDREHVELADPRQKKPEVHRDIRARYARERADALKAGGFTDSTFALWTRQVSASDSLRVRFETLLTRLNAPR